MKDERETEGKSPTTEAERGRRRTGEGKVTAGERALLQSVRARTEKGWGRERGGSRRRAAAAGEQAPAAGGASPGPSQDGLDTGVLAAGTGFQGASSPPRDPHGFPRDLNTPGRRARAVRTGQGFTLAPAYGPHSSSAPWGTQTSLGRILPFRGARMGLPAEISR